MRRPVLVAVLLHACAAPPEPSDDPIGLSVAVGQGYACASAVGRGTWCWGDGLPVTGLDDPELAQLAGIDAVDLDVMQAPMVLDADGAVFRWGSGWTGLPAEVIADDAVAVHGGFWLGSDGVLHQQDLGYGDVEIASDVTVFAGTPACWATGTAWSCQDGLLRAGDDVWVDLDRQVFGSLCGVTDAGDFRCLEGELVDASWDGDVVGFPEFPQRDGFPDRPRFVQVEVDLDRHLCVRDEDGRIACRGGHVPGEVAARTGWVDLDLGFGVTCAMHRDGDVACWGESDSGVASPP